MRRYKIFASKSIGKSSVNDVKGIITLKTLTIDEFKQFMLGYGYLVTHCSEVK